VNGNNHSCCRIVVTGGPGGGKTTAVDLFRRELGDKVVIVPEAATILYTGGFPRQSADISIIQATQRAIYNVQRNLEDIQGTTYSGRALICDRGTIDGAAYWPGTDEDFFGHMGTTFGEQLSRYDGVVFFETAAIGGLSIEGGNPMRIETEAEAAQIDLKLRDLWGRHENFIFVPHNHSFIQKITMGLAAIKQLMQQHQK
jgi:hypothetical protein